MAYGGNEFFLEPRHGFSLRDINNRYLKCRRPLPLDIAEPALNKERLSVASNRALDKRLWSGMFFLVIKSALGDRLPPTLGK